MIGVVMDALLMLLLAAALGYGVRLERRLKTLREGQMAFAGAVNELNLAASRAEAALASLRASGQETDLLHDRIVKARALKTELETLIARAPTQTPLPPRTREGVGEADGWGRPGASRTDGAPTAEPTPPGRSATTLPLGGRESLRPVSGGLLSPEQVERFTPVLQALAANQAAKQSLNRARRSLDEDLFAA
ncbi:MAG: hypothetical protein KF910_11000 [Brevundimonas sp.]|uniref:DUF6468 domain-containing protein n=1 Tax=Brevundimonas sp. TaxID=1871086 RepID=UPI0025C33ADA|nr:DUF6468 domain-containing protein [Brevundimonas sp.]MBX3478129.1 hypothetical protein [Brevundimonas sp.]